MSDITTRAQLLRAIADGGLEAAKEFECYREDWFIWHEVSCYINYIVAEPDNWQVRRKPRTIMIGTTEVQAGITGAPKHGTTIWIADPTGVTYVRATGWTDDAHDLMHLKRGLIHLSKEPAEAMGRALAAITEHET